ncbi:MAG TPA: TIGR00725 family protein [Actinomycetota bacterium]
MIQIQIAVCGPGVATEEEGRWAEEAGRLLAEEGAVVVCGGMTGVMDAAARGARQAGGLALGILPGRGLEGASEHLSAAVVTGMGEARNALVVRSADAVLAIAGEYGTLSEIALALKMGVPVVGLRTWELAKGGEPVEAFVRAAGVPDAVREAMRLARERRS